jgi:hypothetical protein
MDKDLSKDTNFYISCKVIGKGGISHRLPPQNLLDKVKRARADNPIEM